MRRTNKSRRLILHQNKKKKTALCVSTMPIYFVFNQTTDMSKLVYSLFNISTPLHAIVVRSACVCTCVCAAPDYIYI